MKKIIAVLLALALALTCAVSVSALGDILSNGSGQLTPIFADFDPSAITEMLSGMDFSGILNDLGMGDLGSLLGGFDLSSLLGSLNLEDLLGGLIPGGEEGTEAPTTTAPATTTTAPATSTTAPSTTKAPSTTAPTTNIPQTGDAGVGVAAGLFMLAGAAFVFTRRKASVK